ncbi:MAG TPA: DUF6603 domain-containing protein [Actinomycetes bacterium]|jgi:hypothetical protein|nr:DUF6603 domain-containing protein [Actinomycetes bacterium]
MTERGTLEVVGQALGELLAPLEEHLRTEDGAKRLFTELGLVLPDAFLARPDFAAALRSGATAAGHLPGSVTALVNAVSAGDLGQILAASQALYGDIDGVVRAITTIATQLDQAAAAVSAIPAADVRAFASDLPERLLNYLAVQYLDRRRRDALAVLFFTGLVDEIVERADVNDPNRPSTVRRQLRPDRLPDLFRDPLATLADLYKWGQLDLDAARLLEAVRRMLALAGRLVYIEPNGAGGQPELRARDATVRANRNVSPPGLDIVPRIALSDGIEGDLPLSPGLSLHLALHAAVEASTTITVRPPLELSLAQPTVPVSGSVALELRKASATAGRSMILFGLAGGPRIETTAVRTGGNLTLAWDVEHSTATGVVELGVALEGGRVVITLEGADGFLAAILPDGGLTLEANLAVGWSSATGLFFRGGVGLQVDAPVDFALGPVKLSAIHLGIAPDSSGLVIEASAAVSARLGPFAIAVERMGFRALLSFPDSGGNLRFADLQFAFKPPSGLGLSLDASVVSGGGFLFLDPDQGQYAGVLELTVGPVSVKAIGILTTKLPGGAQGWALLLLVFGEFPAVQLGFGFTLTGVGGIIGLQHGVSLEALQSGLRTGVLDSVLFPSDPVANAPQIINQLKVVFPITPRALTIGPALQIGWGTPALLRISLAIVLQLDNVLGPGDVELTRVVLLGQLRVEVPPLEELGDNAPQLVKLLVDVVGGYDTRERKLAIDARLRDSFIALLAVTGSMVLRAEFGDHPRFILAVGGFHPRFTDLPPGIPPQDRLGIVLRYGILTVQISGYLAVTSNTFQVGAQASLEVSGGGFRIEAALGFDALFVFEPVFHFEIDFRLSASISFEGIDFASISVRGALSGPGRWRAHGKASISLLFFDVDIDFTVEWGAAAAAPLESAKVGAALVAALSDPANWVAQLPSGGAALVTLRDPGAVEGVIAHPLGALAVTQKVVPLQLQITRVGQARPSDGNLFDITTVQIGTRTLTPTLSREHFARSQYLDLTEEQKLATPSFEEFPAGAVVSTAEFRVPSSQVAFDPEFETVYLGEPEVRERLRPPVGVLVAGARFGAAARSQLRARDALLGAGGLRVELAGDRFAVTDPATMAQVVTLAEQVASSFTLATQAAAAHGGPAQVVEALEVAQ